MAGHMGDKVRTMQNIEIIKSDLDNELLFVKGSIPGAKNTSFGKKIYKNISKLTTKEKVEVIEKLKKYLKRKRNKMKIEKLVWMEKIHLRFMTQSLLQKLISD